MGVRHFVKYLLPLCDPLSPAPLSLGVPFPERLLETFRGVPLSCTTEQLHQGIRMLMAIKEVHAGSVEAGKLTRVLSAPVLQCCKRLHTHPKDKKAGKCIRAA